MYQIFKGLSRNVLSCDGLSQKRLSGNDLPATLFYEIDVLLVLICDNNERQECIAIYGNIFCFNNNVKKLNNHRMKNKIGMLYYYDSKPKLLVDMSSNLAKPSWIRKLFTLKFI